MTILYQLPCPECKKVLHISITQAGEQLACECGCIVTVPTMREIKQLPVVEIKDEKKSRPWSPVQGGLFAAGILLIAIGVYGHIQLTRARNAIDISRPEFIELDFDIQELTPFEAWRTWENIERSRARMSYRPTPEFIANRKKYDQLTASRYAAWASAAVGIACVIAAVILRTLSR